MRFLLVLVILISVNCTVIQASGNTMAVTVPVFTRHFPAASADLNQHNYGVGFEYTLQKDVSLTAGMFNNSLRKETVYLGFVYTPLRVVGLHTGVVIGLDLSGGYNSINPVKPVIGSFRFATGNEFPLGFNIDILPAGVNRDSNLKVYGAVAGSVKYSF